MATSKNGKVNPDKNELQPLADTPGMSSAPVTLEINSQVLEDPYGGRILSDSVALCPGLPGGTAKETRAKYGWNPNEVGTFNCVVNCVSDSLFDVRDIEFHNRVDETGCLVKFVTEGQLRHGFIDWSHMPYHVQFDGPVHPSFYMLPLMAKVANDNPEFKAAFEKMLDANNTPEERAQAAGIASDAFAIEVDEIDNMELTFNELTPEMANRFLETGEFFEVSEDGKPIIDYCSVPTDPVQLLNLARQGAFVQTQLEWDEEAQLRIPDLAVLEDYEFIPEFRDCLIYILKNQLHSEDFNCPMKPANLLLTGKPGTGKSKTIEALAATLGMPVYTVTCSRNTEERMYQGGIEVEDGVAGYQPGEFLMGYAKGGFVVMEEMNLAQPGVIQGLCSVGLEGRDQHILADGSKEDFMDGARIIPRNPNAVVFATGNPGGSGTQPISRATARRFQRYNVEDPKPETIIAIIESKNPNITHEQAKWIYSAYSAVHSALRNSNATAEAFNSVTLSHCNYVADLLHPAYNKTSRQALEPLIRDLPDINEATYDVACEALDAVPEL